MVFKKCFSVTIFGFFLTCQITERGIDIYESAIEIGHNQALAGFFSESLEESKASNQRTCDLKCQYYANKDKQNRHPTDNQACRHERRTNFSQIDFGHYAPIKHLNGSI